MNLSLIQLAFIFLCHIYTPQKTSQISNLLYSFDVYIYNSKFASWTNSSIDETIFSVFLLVMAGHFMVILYGFNLLIVDEVSDIKMSFHSPGF